MKEMLWFVWHRMILASGLALPCLFGILAERVNSTSYAKKSSWWGKHGSYSKHLCVGDKRGEWYGHSNIVEVFCLMRFLLFAAAALGLGNISLISVLDSADEMDPIDPIGIYLNDCNSEQVIYPFGSILHTIQTEICSGLPSTVGRRRRRRRRGRRRWKERSQRIPFIKHFQEQHDGSYSSCERERKTSTPLAPEMSLGQWSS